MAESNFGRPSRLDSPYTGAMPAEGPTSQNYLPRDLEMSNTPELTNILGTHLNLSDTSDVDSFDREFHDYDSSVEDSEPPEVAMKALAISSLPTGLCYDERMRYHSEVSAAAGQNVHPEDPRRIYYIFKELREAGLVDTGNKDDLITDQPLYRIHAREATRDEVELVHTAPLHWNFVEATSRMTDEELIDLSDDGIMDSIYFNALSFFSGKLSAGGAIETCKAVFERRTVKNAIAVIRPPGHHAEVDKTMGFCLFNNVCIASKVCQREFGESCRKIMILDWDVHHGNGCQKAFYDDPNILYISLHVHMDGKFYPSGQDGAMDKVGAGAAIGKNVNIPWPTKGMGDGDYMYAFQHVVMPIATEFDPDLVIVAAGFDAAAGDELGGCFVTPPCYGHMTHMLMSLANGKVAVCLEGGYNFAAISKSALAVTRTLMGEPPDRLEPTRATDKAVEAIEMVRHIQSTYWDCLKPKAPIYDLVSSEPLSDLLRQAQAKQLYEKHRMTKLPIFRDTISPSFEDQVLSSPGFDTRSKLLVILHDSPDLYIPSGRQISNPVPSHRAQVVDGVGAYVDWAIAAGFGVLDINIPERITPIDSEVPIPYASVETDAARLEGEKLISYIYTNYIEPSDATSVVLIGVGNAFHAIAKLLSEIDVATERISGVIGFIGVNPVRPVGASNPQTTGWFRQHSLVYVIHSHALWSKDGKKVSRRYGDLRRAEGNSANDMMLANRAEAVTWILEKVHDEDATEEESGDQGEVQVKVDGSPREHGISAPAEGDRISSMSEDVSMGLDQKSF